MIFRNLDENGDWQSGKGKQDFCAQNQAIGLNIKTRILSWVGDCFFDLRAGIDWVNRLGSKNQKLLLDADLRRLILTTQNVTGLNSFDSFLDGRKFTANFSVNTIYSRDYVDSLTVEV